MTVSWSTRSKYWRWMQSLKWSKWMHRWDCDNFDLLFLEPQNRKFYNLTQEEFNSIWTVYI